jgi:predicted ATPase
VPASLLSDVTVSLAALIVALYFHDEDLTIVEEIERNLHPAVLGRLVEAIYDASSLKQIIATTHHPELVKYIRLEDLLLVSREAGFSTVSPDWS